ncbi:MAG: hypothetical protein JWL97_3646 [Gemmatimonadales bacterium]|jgi:hypothetical protein|nr:hypothetical protein [Gemmatimonadales bacterium]
MRLYSNVAKTLALHLQFLKALSQLSTGDQSRVRQSVKLISQGYSGSGLRRHSVGRWISYSAGMDLRIIVVEAGEESVLVHVGHHDAAYRWANAHQPVIGSDESLLAVIPDSSPVEVAESTPNKAKPLLSTSQSILETFGVPPRLAEHLGRYQNDELLDMISYLAPELQEGALSALAEMEAHPPIPLIRPSDAIVVNDDSVLDFALSLPAELWRIFLHPKQRYVVDLPTDNNVLVRGGPGTGKTVAMAHRFVRMAHESKKMGTPHPAMIVLNKVTKEIMSRQLSQLGIAQLDVNVWLVSELPKSRTRLLGTLTEAGPVVIDEGQDLPVTFVAALAEFMDENKEIPPLTVSYDANQAIFNPSAKALSKLQGKSDVVTLSYCYRSTREISGAASAVLRKLHSSYSGRDFQNRHHVEAARDAATASVRTPLTGPKVDYIRVDTRDQVFARVEAIVQFLVARYKGFEGLAVIVVADQQDRIVRDLQSTFDERSLDIPVITPMAAKGEEYFAGVVVDALDHDRRGGPSVEEVTIGRYKLLSGLYVATSRFRDRLSVVVMSNESPAWSSSE